MRRTTGVTLQELEHLRQSIEDILTTPIGTRVMRREYGSELFDLIDAPLSSTTLMLMFAATANALDRWEPRIRVRFLDVEQGIRPGQILLTLTGEYLPSGEDIIVDGLILG